MLKTTPSKKNQRCLIGPVFTTIPVAVPQANSAVIPILIGLPRAGEKCAYTNLCRSTLNSLILGPNPPVKSVSVRKQYAVRGKRLIYLASLLEYLAGLAAAQQPTVSEPAFAGTERVDNKNKTAPSVTVQKPRRAAKPGRSATK